MKLHDRREEASHVFTGFVFFLFGIRSNSGLNRMSDFVKVGWLLIPAESNLSHAIEAS